MRCSQCEIGDAGTWGWCSACRLRALMHALAKPGLDITAGYGGWSPAPPSPPPAPPPGSYEPLDSTEATQVLLDTAQGKYHRESYHDRVLALEKDGIFLCRKR